MKRLSFVFITAAVAMSMIACAGAKRPTLQPKAAPPGASLWEQPTNLTQRDLYYGPWGVENAPVASDTFTFVARKHTGVNLGMTVVDSKGREWSVKQPYPGGLDDEAPVEVTVSRLLSAIGYHQPPVYYLPSFTLKDDWGTHVEVGGRFRLKTDALKEVDSWAWDDSPFVGSAPYDGLLTFLMMVNSTDLKASNNSVYEHRKGDLVELWYAPRDIGAALGDTNRIAPFKGDIDAFERGPFVLGVNNGHVQFAYNGWYKNLVRDRIEPADVIWISNLLGQLSDRQWRDAFRAGGWDDDVAGRYIRAFRAKIEEGKAIGRRGANGDR